MSAQACESLIPTWGNRMELLASGWPRTDYYVWLVSQKKKDLSLIVTLSVSRSLSTFQIN